MAKLDVPDEEQLVQFLEIYGGDRPRTELIAFWGRHPNAKFTRAAICCAVDCKRTDLDRALKAMVEAGLVDTCMIRGIFFYWLSANEEIRRLVLKLASLNWDQWQLMVKRLGKHPVATS